MWNIAAIDAVRHPAFLVRAEPDSGTLRVFGELDTDSAPDLLTAATERLHGYRSITVDLTALMFIDAAGLGALVTLSNRCQAAGTRLAVVGASDHIARLFTVAGMTELLTSSPLVTVIPHAPVNRRLTRSAPDTPPPAVRAAALAALAGSR